jgi:hypothetical protein
MRNQLTNLLPRERRDVLRVHYWERFVVIGCFMAMALLGVAGVLLLPSYVLLSKHEETKQQQLSALAGNTSTLDERQLSKRLTSLTANVRTLIDLADEPSISHLMRSILTAHLTGITLTSFTYTPDKEGAKPVPGSLIVTGVAATRETLRTFQMTLQALPFVGTAALPVSAYAQSSAIPFTITVTLKP